MQSRRRPPSVAMLPTQPQDRSLLHASLTDNQSLISHANTLHLTQYASHKILQYATLLTLQPTKDGANRKTACSSKRIKRRFRCRPTSSALLLVFWVGAIVSGRLGVHSFVVQRYPQKELVSPMTSPLVPSILNRRDPAYFSQRQGGNRRLTTKINGEEDPVKLSIKDQFRIAGDKFKTKPGTYLLIPVIAAGVGWFTNWLAVQMIFYPIQFRGIPIWRRDEIPLGFLGWQGIVPCKTRPMSEAMVHMVTSQLLTVKEAFARLDPAELAKRLAPEVPKIGEEVLLDLLPKTWLVGLAKALFFGLPGTSQRILQHFNFRFLKNMCQDMIINVDSCFNIQNCVQNQMLQDRTLLGQLFKRCGHKELDFLTDSGLWFGFLLGLIQMAVALFFENPWTLSIGGLIVGLATNWLALKWIFEPVNPTRIGPFIVQGQFLRRQTEVAAEFSKFFANRILTSHQVWNSILNDPTTSPSFYALFARHFMGFVSRVTGALRINLEPEVLQLATKRVMAKLPDHIPVLHSYIDSTLGLETTLRVKMEQMTSLQFERVLHPIFEEDEATLIAAGAVLGFAAGLIQQGLETGQIKLPDVWALLNKRIRPYIEYPRARVGALWKKSKTLISYVARSVLPNSWRAANGSADRAKTQSASDSEALTDNTDVNSVEDKEDDHNNSADLDEKV